MRRNRLFLALAGGGILLVGLVTGALLSGGFPAWAFGAGATPSTGSPTAAGKGAYCQLYEQTLASELHVSQSALESANQDAIKAVIQQAYKDGKITQAQETNLLNHASAIAAHPCAALPFGRHRGGGSGPQLSGARQAILSAVAGRLGIPAATLQSDLASGQTIPTIAQAKSVPLTGTNGVNAVYLNAVQTQLNQAVSAGTITQAQSAREYAMAQKAVASGHYPLLTAAHGHGAPPQPGV